MPNMINYFCFSFIVPSHCSLEDYLTEFPTENLNLMKKIDQNRKDLMNLKIYLRRKRAENCNLDAFYKNLIKVII